MVEHMANVRNHALQEYLRTRMINLISYVKEINNSNPYDLSLVIHVYRGIILRNLEE